MKTITKSNEFMLAMIILVVWLLFGMINPDILSLANIFSLSRAIIVPSIFALTSMLIIISGGFDMSFYAIGSFSAYFVTKYVMDHGMENISIFAIFGASIIISILLECINWVFIDKMSVDPFIVTLGTQVLLKGLLLAFVSTSFVNVLPNQMLAVSKSYLATTVDANGMSYILHMTILIVIVLYVVIHFILEKTMYGRSLYALGNDVIAAHRAGINVSKVRFITFVICGVICGVGGVIHTSLARMAAPMSSDMVGQELLVIAAVMIGTGSSKRAKGSVVCTFLGVILLKLITNNLILLKVPSYWQNIVYGVVVLIGLIARTPNLIKRLKGKEETV